MSETETERESEIEAEAETEKRKRKFSVLGNIHISNSKRVETTMTFLFLVFLCTGSEQMLDNNK